MGLFVFNKRRIEVLQLLYKFFSRISQTAWMMQKREMALIQKYFSIKKFRRVLQLPIDSIKFRGLAPLNIGTIFKNYFPKTILPRLEFWWFYFLMFHSYNTFQITEFFCGSCSHLPSHLNKECLFTRTSHIIKPGFETIQPQVMSESERSFCFLNIRFTAQ